MIVDVPNSLNSDWHLRAEISRLLVILEELLARQRQRGRTPAADAVRSFVIEEGEAEGLLTELAEQWADIRTERHEATPYRADSQIKLDVLADSAAHHGGFTPLRHVAKAFDLTATELDARFGRLFAYLNYHVGHTRPTLGLVLQLAGMRLHRDAPSSLGILDRPLVRDGLIELEGDGPLPGRVLRISHDMARRLTAVHQVDSASAGFVHSPVDVGLLDRLVLPDPVRDATTIWANEARARSHELPCLLIAGAPGSGRSTLAHAAASVSGLSLVKLTVDTSALEKQLRTARREVRWHQAALLLEIPNGKTDWLAVWDAVEGRQYPLIISLPPEVAEEVAATTMFETILVTLEEPDATRRCELWQRMAPRGIELEAEAVGTLASSFRFNPGRIEQVFRRARSKLRLHPPGKRRLTEETLHAAARALGRTYMGELAQRLPCPYRPEDLVVPPRVQAELDLALAWVRQQVKVLGEWGFAQRVPFGYGLSALFSGPSGTGKTMAAQVLARQLNLDLYRVDLSRVVSKYIGETEKLRSYSLST